MDSKVWIKMGEYLSMISEAVKFLPDECSVKWYRVDKDRWKMVYEEKYNYLPEDLANLISQYTVKTLQEMLKGYGIEKINFSLIDKGIRAEIEGSIYHIGGFLVGEIMGQTVKDWGDAFRKIATICVSVVALFQGKRVRSYDEAVEEFIKKLKKK